MKRTKIRIEKITLHREFDDSPDLSFLQQDYLEVKNEKERLKYIRQDKQRLEDYYNEKWSMLGIIAKAEVSYEMTNVYPKGNRRIERFTSGGLWGIESDSGEKCLKEIEAEQLEDLKLHLKTFGVDISNFKSKIVIE